MRYLNEELSNISYTNKDFSAIYPELLDFADSVSDKWKPSLSNESDPGVVLLKLAALMADKNNYNIDKNILELFPMSVTQYANAREIYEQCGYSMHYYRAAEVVVSITPDNIQDSNNNELTKGTPIVLDKFTTVSGADKSVAYTLICDLQDTPWDSSNIYPEDINLSYGVTTDFIALQGKHVKYSINSADFITYENLDYNNRLYFSERLIAENGIFITNINSEGKDINNFNQWVRVDNLWTQAPDSYCYKLGISRDSGRVYIEFPSDIAGLIKSGLRIYYIVTDGARGSIQARYLDSFLDDKCAPVSIGDEKLSQDSPYKSGFTNENIHIVNNRLSTVGKDPETVEEAYTAYERYKNTFDTLVSINDYNNYLRQDNKYLSNGFICDRTNDIQHTYTIKSYYDGKINNDRIFEEKEADQPYLNAFDLKIYGLKGSSNINDGSEDAFKLSFQPVLDSTNIAELRNFIEDMSEDTKSICHDFRELTSNKLAFIFLEFVIDAKIIPYTKLDSIQQLSVYGNVYAALLKLFNATNLEFGQAIDYNKVYDTIKGADGRIQALILDDITYTPAYYIKSQNDSIIRKLDPTADGALISTIEQEIATKCVLAGVTPLYMFDKSFTYELGNSDIRKYTEFTSVSSSWTKILSANTSYTLQDNENIYIKAPNYVVDEQFGAFVKCFYNIEPIGGGLVVGKGGVRQLTGTEYIAFFWKADDDSNYEYKIFSGNTCYIQPQYNIKNDITKGGVNTSDKQPEQDYTVRNFIASVAHSNPSGTLLDEEVADAVSKVQDLTLTAKQVISIVKPNTIKIDENAKIYFRRNSIQDGKYILRNNDTLGVGEYIYYTTNPRSSITELGAGTGIVFKGDVSSIEVPALTSTEDIVEFSLAPLKYLQEHEYWVDCKQIAGSELVENQFYSLGKGSSILLAGGDCELKSTGYTPIGNTVTIKYKSEGDEVWTTLPQIDVSDNNKWQAKTFLNITGTAETPQVLAEGHLIKLGSNEIQNTTIQFYPSLNLVGDSSSYTIPESSAVKAVTYTLSDSNSGTVIKHSFNSTSTPCTVGFTLLAGNYLLPFDLIGPAVDFSVYPSDTVKVVVNDSDSTGTWHTGRNYIQIKCGENEGTHSYEVKFTASNVSEAPQELVVYAPLKYELNTHVINIEEDTFNKYNIHSRFMKDFEVATADVINNPLEAKSFLDSNHPYNRCCICKWKLPSEVDNQIRITNKIK